MVRATFSFFFVVVVSLAVHSNTGISAETEESTGAITGTLDLRPSYAFGTGSWITDNTVEFGYKFNPTYSLSYLQWFQTGLLNRVADEGIDLKIQDGFIRGRASNLWKSEDETLSFSYQARLYVPTSSASRDVGMITRMRNYFILSKKVSPSFSFSVMELPVFQIFNRSGEGSTVNPAFENRVYFIADVTFSEKLSLSFPILFHQTRYRDHDSSLALNDTWGFTLWIYPELTYNLTEKINLGLAYYSANLVASDLSETTLQDGLESGAVEFSFSVSL